MEGGYYYQPTIFANVDNKMRIAQEEIFGPVVCVIKYDDDEEAVAIANDSIYGLAGGVFSTNIARAEAVGAQGPHRHDVDQQLPRLRRVLPVRRLQAVGRRPRAGQVGPRGVHAGQAHPRPLLLGREDELPVHHACRDDKKIEGFSYVCPTAVIAGHGSLSSIYKVGGRPRGCKRAMILTDPGVRAGRPGRPRRRAASSISASACSTASRRTRTSNASTARLAMARELQGRLHRQRRRRQRHRRRQDASAWR